MFTHAAWPAIRLENVALVKGAAVARAVTFCVFDAVEIGIWRVVGAELD